MVYSETSIFFPWSFRWLLVNGRMVLVSVVLQSILVYWFYMFIILNAVVFVKRRNIFHFLWASRLDILKYHLSFWERISKSKYLGGCGIKNLSWFNRSLCAKSMWQSFFNKGLWGKIAKMKYLKSFSLNHWIHPESRNAIILQLYGVVL